MSSCPKGALIRGSVLYLRSEIYNHAAPMYGRGGMCAHDIQLCLISTYVSF